MKHTTPFCHPCNTVVLSVFAIAGFGPFEPYSKLGSGTPQRVEPVRVCLECFYIFVLFSESSILQIEAIAGGSTGVGLNFHLLPIRCLVHIGDNI